MNKPIGNDWVGKKKLTKANSYMAGDTIFYVAKKLKNEAVAQHYWAYLYPSGIVVRGDEDKDKLLKWLDDNIERIEEKKELHELD